MSKVPARLARGVQARLRAAPRRLLRWASMPSTHQYDLVPNDDYDTRIPLHPDEAFHYGITFNAKYIGTMDVPRPTSRVEIVAAMRRIRYEFKAKGVKKKKVTFDVSVDGVRVTSRKKKGKTSIKEGAKLFGGSKSTSSPVELMHHPIYRIFYVSHDSSDLKIFSYIARDGATNVFKCNVFKSTKKSQAMRIVRTVGQAFEVCHKLSINDETQASTSSVPDDPAASDGVSEQATRKEGTEGLSECASAGSESGLAQEDEGGGCEKLTTVQLLPPPPRKEGRRSPLRSETSPALNVPELPECVTRVEPAKALSAPLGAQHELQLLHEKLEQQQQQTRAAVAQLLLLRDQLAAEQAARCEAQTRTHQLLVHNKELLDHIAALVAHLQDKERGIPHTPINIQQLTMVPQAPAPTSLFSTTDAKLSNNIDANNPDNAMVHFLLNSAIIKSSPKNENNNVTGSSEHALFLLNDAQKPTISINNQDQNDILAQFQNVNLTDRHFNKNYYQNNNAFPAIAPLSSKLSVNQLYQLYSTSPTSIEYLKPQSVVKSSLSSQNSLASLAGTPESKGSTPDALSSDDAVSFIMPLSHSTTLQTTDTDGRIRLIVPITPSGSSSDVGERRGEAQGPPVTLRVAGDDGLLSCNQPNISRTTSEKVPNRSELMSAMRAQWTRHTTK